MLLFRSKNMYKFYNKSNCLGNISEGLRLTIGHEMDKYLFLALTSQQSC